MITKKRKKNIEIEGELIIPKAKIPDLDLILNSFSTGVSLCDGSKPDYEGDKPEKGLLYFGCNYNDVPTIVIQWSEKGRGFGSYTFQYKDGKMICDNECDSPETVKRVLCMMVDQCEFTGYYRDENEKKKWKKGVKNEK
jgi:hypothetical protein